MKVIEELASLETFLNYDNSIGFKELLNDIGFRYPNHDKLSLKRAWSNTWPSSSYVAIIGEREENVNETADRIEREHLETLRKNRLRTSEIRELKAKASELGYKLTEV